GWLLRLRRRHAHVRIGWQAGLEARDIGGRRGGERHRDQRDDDVHERHELQVGVDLELLPLAPPFAEHGQGRPGGVGRAGMGTTWPRAALPSRARVTRMPLSSTCSAMPSTRPTRKPCMTSVGMATMRPNAVALSAIEMPPARNAERCDGSAAPTAANAVMRPEMVPSRPPRGA